MTSHEELLAALASVDPDYDGEPVPILKSDLKNLDAGDLPVGTRIEVMEKIDADGVRHIALDCVLVRGDEASLSAEIRQEGWRKFWIGPLGVEEYQNLARAAVEARTRGQGDVAVLDVVDEDVVFGFTYSITLPWGGLRKAFDHAVAVHSEVLEAAEAVRVGIDDMVATAFKRLEGWGVEPFDGLVDRMRSGTAADKGRALEELVTRLFNTVPGFTATGNVVTQTEEIDIRIQNATDDAFWRDESFLLLAECKNWSGKCGKDEFVLFRTKLQNRVGRATCGFLVSWNGFADTVTKEMLRGSEGSILVVPVTGSDLRGAVLDGDFPARLKALHQAAVFL